MTAADAEEMVQEAARQFLGAGGVADPADAKGLLQALGSRVNGLAVNRRRKKAERAVQPTADGAFADHDEYADSQPDPERRVLHAELARRATSALLERLVEDDLATAIVMQEIDGVEDPADQAKVLCQNVLDIYKARRRLKTHTEAVEKTMEDW